MKVTLLVAAIFYLIPIWADINSTCFPCFVSNPLKSLQSRYYLHRVDEKAEIQGQIMRLAQGHGVYNPVL